MTVLELDHVSYAYPRSGSPALDDVSLEVEPGELVVVAGASGSGKSTLLRVASGLVPHFHGGTFTGRFVTGSSSRIDSVASAPAPLRPTKLTVRPPGIR